MPRPYTDSVGERFNRLLVVTVTRRAPKRYLAECMCDCGTAITCDVQNLRSGNTKSCGCLRDELSRSRIKHGHNRVAGDTPEYRAWIHILCRCNNPSNAAYENYGGRGITICDRWYDFSKFLADMGHRPEGKTSIDRIDNAKGYEPGNCRWADAREQANNRRSNFLVEWRGEISTLAELAARLGIGYQNLQQRVYRGWSLERAILTPVVSLKGSAPR